MDTDLAIDRDTAPSPQRAHIRAWGDQAYPAHCAVRVTGPLRPTALRAALTTVADHGVLAAPHPAPGGWFARGALRADLAPDGDAHILALRLPAEHADPAGLGALVHAIARAYDGGGPPPSVTYGTFAEWQNALAEEDTARRDRAVRRVAALADGPRLPFTPAGAAPGAWAARTAEVAPGPLEAAAAALGATPEEFLLACWQVLLWRQTGAADLALGVVTDGRVYDELAALIGPCAKALPVLVRTDDGDRFGDVLARARRGVAEARDDVAFFAWPRTRTHPAWGFEFWTPARATTADGVEFRVVEQDAWTGPFTARLSCARHPDALRLTLGHRRGPVPDAFAAHLLDQVATLAADAAARPDVPVSRLRAITGARARAFSRSVNPAPRGPERWRCAHQMFEDRAASAPDRTALHSGADTVTYGELNRRANRLARHLGALGAGPETLVGIRLDRGADLVTAMIAVHKAGAAYVPIDPSYPRDHVELILRNSRLPIMIADDPAAAPDGDCRVVPVADPAIDARDATDLGLPVPPGRLAYARHTSGSTGAPKQVRIEHAALANFLNAMRRAPGITPGDHLVAVTTFAFDISELELWLPLTSGARVTIAGRRDAADPAALARLLDRSGATIMQATPVTWRMLLATGWAGAPGLTALAGGEAVPAELAAELRPRVHRLWNMYGPTETTIWSTCAELPGGGHPVSVGRPIDNTCVHILDADLAPVPVGMVGELCIGGRGVARGYGGRPELTAERFVPDPYDCHPHGRLYRTGDLARVTPDGDLYVLGRTDSQVKVRGFRIELGAVESALLRHPAVGAAVAVTVREASGETRLDAHVVLRGPATVADLRGFLQESVPPAMVPTRIGVRTSLPLTANGKVDRTSLPEIAAEPPPERPAPRGVGVAGVVTGVWSAVLGVAEPGATDNFFDLGGHSVLLVEAARRLSDAIGREVSPLTLLEHPTIAALARHLDSDGPADAEGGGDRAPGRGRLLRRRSRVEA